MICVEKLVKPKGKYEISFISLYLNHLEPRPLFQSDSEGLHFTFSSDLYYNATTITRQTKLHYSLLNS